jgi:uncharacterized repeat protein (TIGR03803 family)
MKLKSFRTNVELIIAVWLATVIAQAQTFNTLINFDGTNGANPALMSLVQGSDGQLYGTTSMGGANNSGTIFRITPTGKLTTLYSFCTQTNCTDGANPNAALVLATNGNFYGTTPTGGANSNGTIFKITSSGVLSTLYSFCAIANCTDGANPSAGLVQATDGNFYGTTGSGGAGGLGTVFRITPGGNLTLLHSFAGSDGANPSAGLIQATDGDLYGTTFYGSGPNCIPEGCGSVFKTTPSGVLTTMYSFTDLKDAGPRAGLIQASDGRVYGTTQPRVSIHQKAGSLEFVGAGSSGFTHSAREPSALPDNRRTPD